MATSAIVLARDDWETDATVLDQHARLATQLLGRQGETEERRYQNNRAIEGTTNARGAYIERLRYTIKAYGHNMGELAGIEVHADAQYLMTTPLTHNTEVYSPSELTLITSKRHKGADWAQPIFVLQRRMAQADAS